MSQIWKSAAAVASALMLAAPALAHGGGLNAEGCHTNRKTGDYHCHRSSSPPPPPPPSRPAYSSGFTGDSYQRQDTDRRSGAYANCTEARAAGAAPVRIGERGYGSHLDRDGDGIGCE
ncbi:hypothetical protein BBF93_04755 [Hyphomonas sp. CACIAM 19H1]|uniref:excalibur calcium-binding domain-containing protein n=1 Tax=Hyphomonas sp. CACIAM 19H1 TaxID=1873716 RepID=UPI000DF03B48|nr:excalibur calcium-binding domain-containing protein [Hyphomonas sp. CACIAM 19H1]AXE63606.1 hypothetical protein BBF93_04755 [Hyphomonas sp. CACIAM 19H1]